MNTQSSIEWQFGNWSGLSPWLGWCILLALAAGGVALAMWCYRDTLRALTRQQRLLFTALRSGFYLSIILCLAGPARVERDFASDHDSRPLAVVVDRSQSMTTADSRGTTRLSQAVHAWKKVEAEAVHSFPALRYFHFSSSLLPDPDLESAATASDAGTETHLFDSLNNALRDAPAGGYGGIVCLTDGLDTTNTDADELSSRALQNHTPLYFAVGQNEQAAHEMLIVRELAVPGRVLRKAKFSTTVLVEARTTHERDVPVTLQVDNQPTAQTTLHLHAGANLIPWTVALNAKEPGLLHLDCKLGDGPDAESTAAAIPVVAQDQIHVLFYEGTLDWSFRFMNSALQSDSSFVVSSLFNLKPDETTFNAPTGEPTLTEFPNKADKFKPYQIVVLLNAYGTELSDDQQKALLDYVHAGGGLLFLQSDTTMARTFSGTALESVLPVIFEAVPKKPTQDASLAQFQSMMEDIGGASEGKESEFVMDNEGAIKVDPLQTFALPANAKRSKVTDLFSGDSGGKLQNLPQFASYAKVHGIKAGGEILAIHPNDKMDGKQPRALLVTQRYGQGQVTSLLTDGLWRWRLSLPSTSHDPEIFWQQLFLALAGQSSGPSGMRFGTQPFFASLGQPSSFRLDNVSGAASPAVTAFAPSGKSQILTVQAGPQSDTCVFQVNPNEPGTWRIQAVDDHGALVETLLRVSNAPHNAELSGLPPDTDGLRKLAESTGGSLLNDGVPDTWSGSNAPNLTTLVSKRTHPLWNNWMVLLVGLGFYVTELILRRRAKLL